MGETGAMAFGQQGGPPATAKQVQELRELLHGAGHTDFRDARGPMGFTQRQAGGKFTRDEAEVFIAQLQAEAEAFVAQLQAEPGEAPPTGGQGGPASTGGRLAADRAPAPSDRPAPLPADDRMLKRLADEHLAAELERRGWIVIPP